MEQVQVEEGGGGNLGCEGKKGTQQILMTLCIKRLFLCKRLLHFSYLPLQSDRIL